MNKIIIFYLILFFGLKYIYKQLNIRTLENNNSKLNKYIFSSNKPTMWVHIPYDKNSRSWESFGSRTSNHVNIPFINLCVDSIFKHNKDDFNIIIVNDESFNEYIPSWKYNLKYTPHIEKIKIRQYGLLNLLYHYGGMVVPYSFFCKKSLIDFYKDNVVSFEVPNISINDTSNLFLPSIDFISAPKNNVFINKLIETYTNIENKVNNTVGNILKENSIIVDGKLIGVKNAENKVVYIDDYFNKPQLIHDRYGLLLPVNDLLRKTKYSWFCRMSEKQLKNSNIFISRELVN